MLLWAIVRSRYDPRCMLHSRKILSLPRIGVWYGTAAILHSRFRIFVNALEGATSDLFPFYGNMALGWREADRAMLTVSLSGENRLRSTGAEACLLPGDYATGLQSQGRFLRYGPSSCLIVEWDPGHFGAALASGSTGRIPLATLERLRRFGRELLAWQLDEHRLRAEVRELFLLLRAEGFPLERCTGEDLWDPAPPWARTLSLSIDRALSSLHERPALADLEHQLGWTRQYIQRRLRGFHERYGYNVVGGWRERLQRWRLLTGTTLVTSTRATTEEVASALGYNGPSALCNAFASAGLPSPSAVRRQVLTS